MLVASSFVLAMLVAGAIARQQLENTLVDTARSNAETTLLNSFFPEEIEMSDPAMEELMVFEGVTRFGFADASGAELGFEAFSQLLNDASRDVFAEFGLDPTDINADFAIDAGDLGMLEPLVDADGNEIPIDAFTFVEILRPVGEPFNADTTTDIVVTQAVLIGDEEVAMSVATPRQPLDDSLAAFTRLGLLLIPLLGGAVALATWLTTSRVLRPVEDIRRQVEQTDSTRLDHHVPRSGNGDEIDRLAGTMNDMLDRLHAASLRQRQFVSDASHELRSPITATIATIETTGDDQIAEQWPEVSATLTKEQQRLTQLVDDLLLLATVDEGEPGPARDALVDLDELALAAAAGPFAVDVDAVIEEPHRIAGSARLLERCLGNLVENAARHATSQVTITVATTEEGGALIRVEDDGQGIPEDQLESIFDRFTRLDDARNRRDGGAGLGLAIARDIARQHEASLTASNRDSGGARFELRFSPPTSPRE